MEGVEALRQRLMSTFAARLDPRFAQYQSPSASRPASSEAYREFLVGEQLGGIACPLERDCLGQAITHYWRAYALDSSFTLPIVVVAALSGQRGECGRTDSIADALRPRHDRLPPFDRARLDWAVAACHGQPAQALEASREAMATSPRSDQLLESSAWLARQNGLLHEAITTTEKLDPARHARDRDYWSNLVTPYHLLGDYQRELEAAQRGRQFLPADPEMLSFEARALVGLGRLSDVNGLLDEMGQATKGAPAAIWIDNVGRELRAHGHQREARAVFERGLRRYRGLPRDQQQGRREDLAMILEDLERWQEAWSILTQIAAESPDDVALQGALGGLAARRGDRGEVQRIDGWLADRKGGDPAFWRARMAALLGDRDRAVELFRQAVGGGLGFDVRYRVHTDPAFEALRDYAPFRELTRPKD
jgi:tetratricopeptide (TPR) repeat protein